MIFVIVQTGPEKGLFYYNFGNLFVTVVLTVNVAFPDSDGIGPLAESTDTSLTVKVDE